MKAPRMPRFTRATTASEMLRAGTSQNDDPDTGTDSSQNDQTNCGTDEEIYKKTLYTDGRSYITRQGAIRMLAHELGISHLEVRRRLGVNAKWEGEFVVERKRPVGRPRKSLDEHRGWIIELLRSGTSLRDITKSANMQGVSKSTLHRYIQTIPKEVLRYDRNIGETHARLLHQSGVSPEVAEARRYHSLWKTIFKGHGVVTGLRYGVFPVSEMREDSPWPEWYQLRVDRPESNRKRYLNERGAKALIDLNPIARDIAFDADRTLYITEGPRKADSAISRGYACVDVPGVRMLVCDANEWERLKVRGRQVRIVFDADAAINPEVGMAEATLLRVLQSLGAHVRALRIPGNNKDGLDDYLGTGRRLEDLPEASSRADLRPKKDR